MDVPVVSNSKAPTGQRGAADVAPAWIKGRQVAVPGLDWYLCKGGSEANADGTCGDIVRKAGSCPAGYIAVDTCMHLYVCGGINPDGCKRKTAPYCGANESPFDSVNDRCAGTCPSSSLPND